MKFNILQNGPIKTAALWVAIAACIVPVLVSCSDKREPAEGVSHPASSDSFTFFDIGRTTKFSDQLRDELEQKLGRDAIERRSILNLEINYPGFLRKYFPQLNDINQQLNYPPRERVDHNTVKLMYRYAQKQNVPFDYVELIFSGYTQTPIIFRIHFKTDEANTIATLKEKYGAPEIIDWKEKNGQSMYWQKDGDFLIASLVPDQFGKHEHQIVIYYVDNIKLLIETERKEKDEKEQQRVKSGKTAF